VLCWQLQSAPGGLAAILVLAHPPGAGHLVHDRQAQPAVGPVLGGQKPQEVRVLVVHRHLQPSAAQLDPQLRRRAGAHHRAGDQFAGQKPGRLDQLLELPAVAHLSHERPDSAGRSGHRTQRQPLPHPRRAGAGVDQGLVQAGIHRQARDHSQLQEDLGHRRLGAAQDQGRARPAKGGMPDGGEHPGAQRVDRLHPAEVADDRRWLLGQLLEDDPLEPGGGAWVEPAGQGQDHAFLLAGPLDSHRGPSISAWLKAKDLTMELALPNSSA
jgi:hypothetical protein